MARSQQHNRPSLVPNMVYRIFDKIMYAQSGSRSSFEYVTIRRHVIFILKRIVHDVTTKVKTSSYSAISNVSVSPLRLIGCQIILAEIRGNLRGLATSNEGDAYGP